MSGSPSSATSVDVDPLIFVIPSYENLSERAQRQARQLLRETGSAVDTALPPWVRSGSSLTSWPGQHAYHNGIPVVIDVTDTLHPDGGAIERNRFLSALGAAYNTTSRPEDMDVTTWQGRGPSVFAYTVGSASTRARAQLIIQQGRRVVRGPGRHAVDRVIHPRTGQGMQLNHWSALVPVAAREACMRNGTMFFVASIGPRADLVRTIHMRRWYRDNPDQDPTGATSAMLDHDVNDDFEASTLNIGHAIAVFVQSRDDWPVRQSNGSYAFNGTYQRVFIYDPSFVHEGVAAGSDSGPFSQAMAAGRTPRLRDLLFISTATQLVFNEDGLLRRAGWVREPGRVFIGGGGNYGTLGACSAMSGNWMQQTAYLSRELTRARQRLSESPESGRRQRRWLQALSDWDCWTIDFVAVTR